jgi:hypothetical protein
MFTGHVHLKLAFTSNIFMDTHWNWSFSRGVDKFFKTLARLASSSEFSLAKSENNSPKIICKTSHQISAVNFVLGLLKSEDEE